MELSSMNAKGTTGTFLCCEMGSKTSLKGKCQAGLKPSCLLSSASLSSPESSQWGLMLRRGDDQTESRSQDGPWLFTLTISLALGPLGHAAGGGGVSTWLSACVKRASL